MNNIQNSDSYINNLYSSPNISRKIKPSRMKCEGHVAHTGRRRIQMGSLLDIQKRPVETKKQRWMNNIKMHI
jgi:hypothetical protein